MFESLYTEFCVELREFLLLIFGEFAPEEGFEFALLFGIELYERLLVFEWLLYGE